MKTWASLFVMLVVLAGLSWYLPSWDKNPRQSGKFQVYQSSDKLELALDLDAIAVWGARVVVTLVEPAELKMLKVPQLGQAVHARGMLWLHLPIADYSIPDAAFEQQWLTQGRELRTLLRHGESVLLHCKGGLGRAGMMAARLLVELGMAPETAIRTVRRARKGAIETSSQLALVRRTQAITESTS